MPQSCALFFAGMLHFPKAVATWAVRIGEISGNQGLFSVSFLMYEPKSISEQARARQETITLKAVCGPNDDGSPCITIMKPDED